MQTKLQSFTEATISTVVGYFIAVGATAVILPLYGLPVQMKQNLAISGLFTVISLARSFCFRRFFNWWHS